MDLSFNRLGSRASNLDSLGTLFPSLRELKLYDVGIEQLPLLDSCGAARGGRVFQRTHRLVTAPAAQLAPSRGAQRQRQPHRAAPGIAQQAALSALFSARRQPAGRSRSARRCALAPASVAPSMLAPLHGGAGAGAPPARHSRNFEPPPPATFPISALNLAPHRPPAGSAFARPPDLPRPLGQRPGSPSRGWPLARTHRVARLRQQPIGTVRSAGPACARGASTRRTSPQ